MSEAQASTAAEPEVLVEKRGRIGLLTLNRPKALNALNLPMVIAIETALAAFRSDAGIDAVVMVGAGGRAFCAGGDIRLMHDLGKAGKQEEALAFWHREYRLNHTIKQYPKPYVALIDGIVMGGGVGLSVHGSHRVAGPRYLFAMPETGIGFFPDVGASFALPRLPGRFGLYLGLTGGRIGRGDGVALGLATHSVAADSFPAIIDALAAGERLDLVLARHAEAPGAAPVMAEAETIATCFATDDPSAVLAALEAHGAAFAHDMFAQETLKTLRQRSPTSLALVAEQLRRGASLDFAEAMAMEFRIVSRICHGHDFYEGVRAVIIDKDQAPRWQPATLREVTEAMVAAYFAPLPTEWTPAP